MQVPDVPLAVVPTTEQLVDLEREIQRLIEKKRRTDLHIIDLEARIHAVETEYFRETAMFGSLLGGLEGYLGATSGTPRRHGPRDVKDTDRLFTHTSSSHPRALAVHSRLVRERTLNPINVGNKKTSGDGSGGGERSHSSSSNSRKRRTADPSWNMPSHKRHR